MADSINHTIRLGRPACPDTPTIDLVTGPIGQARQLDISPQTAVAWHWGLVRVPVGSAAASWTADVRNPTFTPDVADLFVFRLTATNAAGATAIRTLALTATPLPPVFQAVKLTQEALDLTWSTEAGASYQLHSPTSNRRTGPAWAARGPPPVPRSARPTPPPTARPDFTGRCACRRALSPHFPSHNRTRSTLGILLE